MELQLLQEKDLDKDQKKKQKYRYKEVTKEGSREQEKEKDIAGVVAFSSCKGQLHSSGRLAIKSVC